MTRLVLATRNAHKLREFGRLLGDAVEIEPLPEGLESPEETGETFAANALPKARAAAAATGELAFGDDSGIEAAALGGATLLDLNYEEDSSAEVDANVVMTGDGGLVEVQATAERTPLSRASLDELLALAQHGIEQLRSAQSAAIDAAAA